MPETLVTLEKLVGVSFRERMDEDAIEEYTDQMRTNPDAFPAIGVVTDGQTYWRWSGAHRSRAAANAGLTAIKSDVEPGTESDARRLARKDNSDIRAVRRTNKDKRNAVEDALKDPEYVDLEARRLRVPQQAIADACNVTQRLVSKVCEELGIAAYQEKEVRTVLTSPSSKDLLDRNLAGETKADMADELGVTPGNVYHRTLEEQGRLYRQERKDEVDFAPEPLRPPEAPARTHVNVEEEMKRRNIQKGPNALAAEWWGAGRQIALASLTVRSEEHRHAIIELEPRERLEPALQAIEDQASDILDGIRATRDAIRSGANGRVVDATATT